MTPLYKDDTVDADLADSPCVRDARSLVGGFTTEDPSPGQSRDLSYAVPKAWRRWKGT